MNDNTAPDDQAMIAEALRRMKSGERSVPAAKLEEFLDKLNETREKARALRSEEVRRMFKEFVAEASHVRN